MSGKIVEVIELEKTCERCGGTGSVKNEYMLNEFVACHECEERCVVLTDLGKAVLELVARRMGVKGTNWPLEIKE